MPAMRRLRIPDDVAESIRNLHPDLKRKVRSALDDVLREPTIGKILRDELAGLRSCRVARFRIIYRIAGNVIEVVAVGPRQMIYEETWKKLGRESPG
jgi:mRNA interferase RelE/StbE